MSIHRVIVCHRVQESSSVMRLLDVHFYAFWPKVYI